MIDTLLSLGQTVMNRRLGPPVAGEIVGLLLPCVNDAIVVNGPAAEMFVEMFAAWTAAYPAWREKPIVCVAVSLSDAECEQSGAKPGMRVLRWYPADDLEVVE